jgi:predicted PurR-regulated permease PerM
MTAARTRVEFWFTLIWGVLLRLSLIAVVGYGLYRVRFVIVTVVMAVFLALALAPLVEFLDRPRVLPFLRPATRRFLVTLFVFLLLFGLLIGCYFFIFTPLGEELTQLLRNWPQYEHSLQQRLDYLRTQYASLPPDVRVFLEKQDLSRLSGGLTEQLQQIVSQTWRSTWLLVDLILIPVLAYYFVVDSRSLKKEFIFLVPRRRVREVLRLLRETAAVLESYILGQVLLGVIAGVVVGLALHWVGLRYALAMGVVAGVTRIIPIIGPILGGIPIVLLATAQSWELGLWVLVFFSLLHLLESKLLMPRVIGYRVRLHPAIIIIVLLIGSEFFGLMGMFLAAPIAAIIRILINFYIIRPRMRLGPAARGQRLPPSSLGGSRPRRPARRQEPAPGEPVARTEDLSVEHPAVVAPGSYPRSD